MMSFYRLAENALFCKTTPCTGGMPFTPIFFSRTWRTVAPKGMGGMEEQEAWTEWAGRVCVH